MPALAAYIGTMQRTDVRQREYRLCDDITGCVMT